MNEVLAKLNQRDEAYERADAEIDELLRPAIDFACEMCAGYNPIYRRAEVNGGVIELFFECYDHEKSVYFPADALYPFDRAAMLKYAYERRRCDSWDKSAIEKLWGGQTALELSEK